MLPGAGGGLNPYLRLAAFLGSSYDVYAVRAAGLLPGEEAEDSVAQMAGSIVAELDAATVVPDLVFGWSLGGTVGWEVAVRLADRGHLPALVVVDSSPLPRQSTVEGDGVVRDVILSGLGPNPRADTLQRVLSVFDGQVTALADHKTERRYRGRVLLLMCADTEDSGRAEMVRTWRSLSTDLRYGRLDAEHFAVFEQERLPQLTDQITGFLRAEEVVR
jgi:thioesterase domain-containing protein